MAIRSWMKYMGLAVAFAGIEARVFSWLQQAQAAGSPGGEDITMQEVTMLQPVINDAINQGLQSAEVPIIAEVKLIYTGG